ncbi:hypothetical protein HZP66_02230 [Elizabethkingia anophelis]|nr:hypothetical protein [Elizabethkingia anophelis]
MNKKDNINLIDIKERLEKSIAHLKGEQLIKTQKDISSTGLISESSLTRALKGNEKYLTISFLKKYSKYYGFNESWLLEGKGSMLKKQQIQEKEVVNTDTSNFESLPIEEKLNSIYELLINSSTNSNNSVESLIHGLISKDAHQDKYINFMRDKILELETSLESQRQITAQILEIVKDLKLSTH